MAESKSKKSDEKRAEEARASGEPVPLDAAADGRDSRLTKGYPDNPDKPDESTIAQVEELVDEESSS